MCFCPNFGRTDEGGNEKQEISLVWPNRYKSKYYVSPDPLAILSIVGVATPDYPKYAYACYWEPELEVLLCNQLTATSYITQLCIAARQAYIVQEI